MVKFFAKSKREHSGERKSGGGNILCALRGKVCELKPCKRGVLRTAPNGQKNGVGD